MCGTAGHSGQTGAADLHAARLEMLVSGSIALVCHDKCWHASWKRYALRVHLSRLSLPAAQQLPPGVTETTWPIAQLHPHEQPASESVLRVLPLLSHLVAVW